MARSVAFVLFCLSALAGSCACAADGLPADFVTVKRGTLPVILTAPHGGREAIAGVDPRQNRANIAAYRAWGGYQAGTDLNTDLLAQGIAAEIEKLTGAQPYVVIAKFSRRYIDANRPPELGLDSAAARPYYDYYHESIRRFVDEVRARGPALLIDVHGQAKDPEVIMRGTINGRAVESLVRRAGEAAVIGTLGIYGQLEVNGFKIFPANDVPLGGRNEDAGFNGGYTVAINGSHNRDGIDAVQLEFGSRYRGAGQLETSIRNAAKAIVAFHDAYLKQAAGQSR